MNKYPFKSASMDSEKKINLEKGIIPFILTSKTVDRDSEVILPDGGDIDEFKTNPVFLWAHDAWSPSIGKVLTDTIKSNSKLMTADVQFDLDDPFAALIFNKFAKGFLSAGSIRFKPTKIGTEPVLPGQKGVTIEAWKLLEFSAVPIPANPEALSQLAKGLDSFDDERAKDLLSHLNSLKKDFKKHFEEAELEIEESSKAGSNEEIDEDDILSSLPKLIEAAVLQGVQKAFNPMLLDEFVVDEEEYKSVAKAMINLFKNETLPEYQKKYVYDHLCTLYKQFDRKPPEFGQPIEIEVEEDDEKATEPYSISNEDLEKIVSSVKESL